MNLQQKIDKKIKALKRQGFRAETSHNIVYLEIAKTFLSRNIIAKLPEQEQIKFAKNVVKILNIIEVGAYTRPLQINEPMKHILGEQKNEFN